MKAGAFTPATQDRAELLAVVVDVRSMKAGAFTPATHRPVDSEHVGRVDRSMKAGAFTPATRVRHSGELSPIATAQ